MFRKLYSRLSHVRFVSTSNVVRASAGTKTAKSGDEKLVRMSRLPNGVLVATDSTPSPVVRVALVVPGARYEPPQYAGVSHVLRLCAQLGNAGVTGLSLTRGIQQMGASITAAATREHLIFQVHALREFVEEATTLLAHVSTRPTYRHWELDEEVGWDLERDLEAAAECSRTQLSEALHAAAYRNTLGRSLFAPQSLVGNFEAPFLHRYVRTLWTPEHTALVGLGVPHETLIELAERFDFARDSSSERHIEEELYYPNEHEPAPAPDEKFDFFARARYGGGERRIDNCEEVVQAALVTECAGLKDAAASVATAVFAKCLGGVPTSVQHGSGSPISRLNVAANAALRTQHSSAFASALHLPYSDSGLIGAYVAAHKHDIAPVLSAVRARMTKFLKGGFSDDDVKVARQQLLAELQQTAESPEARLQTLASFAGVVQCTPVAGEASKAPSKPLALLTESERLALVERVGAKEVNELANKLLSGKPTLAIVGQLNHAPFLDEIIERS